MPLYGLDKDKVAYLSSDATDGVVQTDFNENANAAWEMARDNMIYGARARLINREFDDVFEENNKRIMALGGNALERIPLFDAQKDVDETGGMFGGKFVLDQHHSTIADLKKKDASVLTIDEMSEEARKRAIGVAQTSRANYGDISSRASLGGDVGGFVGMGAGVMSDPINIAAMLATAPIALEGWGAAILGNAAINTATETAVQFAPGGAREWAQEQGLTPEQMNAETRMAIGGAAAGGAVLGGVFKGVGKGAGWLGEKVFSRNPMEARAAVNELLQPKNAQHLTADGLDQLNLIQRAQQMEDSAAHNVLNTKFTHVDGEAIIKNLERYNEVARAIVDDSYTPKAGAITQETVDVLRQRAHQADQILMEVRDGIDSGQLDDVLKTFLTEDRYQRFRDLVDEYKALGDGNRLGGLSRAEQIIGAADERVAGVHQNAADAATKLEALKAEQAKRTKDLTDMEGIIRETDAKKAKLEKDIVDLHSGKWGQIDEITRNEAHDNLMGQVKALEADRAQYAAEQQRMTADMEAFNKRFTKSERKANRDTASRVDDVERDKLNDLELSREEANLASKPEMAAAREVLQEMKLIEQNKVAYAELYASNPLADASKLRETVSMMELRNRMNDGDAVSIDDVLAILSPEERTRFNQMLDKSHDLGAATDEWVKHSTAQVSREGAANMERVVRNINETLAHFGENLNVSNVLKNMKAVAANARPVATAEFAANMKALVNGNDFKTMVDDFLAQNLNTKVIDPDTGVEIAMSDFMASVKGEEDLIAIIQACKV